MKTIRLADKSIRSEFSKYFQSVECTNLLHTFAQLVERKIFFEGQKFAEQVYLLVYCWKMSNMCVSASGICANNVRLYGFLINMLPAIINSICTIRFANKQTNIVSETRWKNKYD